jgi:hypothetical protein
MLNNTYILSEAARTKIADILEEKGFEGVDSTEISLFEYNWLYRGSDKTAIYCKQTSYADKEEFYITETKITAVEIVDLFCDRQEDILSFTDMSAEEWLAQPTINNISDLDNYSGCFRENFVAPLYPEIDLKPLIDHLNTL